MQEKTLGEARIRTDFNVANSSLVGELKGRTAELINICQSNKSVGSLAAEDDAEANRLWSLAQTAYEEAAMWAVKAATI